MNMFMLKKKGNNMFHLAYHKRKLKKSETPQKMFEKLRGEYAVLLESASHERGKSFEQYSFIGYEPFMVFSSKNNFNRIATVNYKSDEVEEEVHVGEGDGLKIFENILKQVKIARMTKGLPPFIGGAVGYFSYDFGTRFEGINQKTQDDLETPDMFFVFLDKVVAFDHAKKELYFFGLGETEEQAESLVKEISRDAGKGVSDLPRHFSAESEGYFDDVHSNLSLAEYIAKVQNVHQFLKRGETYQVNFAQRFCVESDVDPFIVYKKLAALNPSPMACFLDFPDIAVVSSSPERLVSAEGNAVETRPIKGTVRRGKNEKEDEVLIQKLMTSEKDDAELSMIVDLARNDMGKICKPGTVKVVEHRVPEKYSHVIHTVSTVRGTLEKGKDFADVMEAFFPGGSITGCPKKRTMEIIDSLEDFRRGVYCGSAGYVSFNGNFDFNILIRTLAWKDGTYYFHAGGGIVADSDPQKEYKESLQKARAIMECFRFYKLTASR